MEMSYLKTVSNYFSWCIGEVAMDILYAKNTISLALQPV